MATAIAMVTPDMIEGTGRGHFFTFAAVVGLWIWGWTCEVKVELKAQQIYLGNIRSENGAKRSF